MVKCSANNCNSTTYNRTPGLSFHRFPKDDKLKKIWLQNVNRPAWKLSSSSVLCSNHFEPHLKDSSVFCTVLRPGAVPTLFESNSEVAYNSKRDFSRTQKITFALRTMDENRENAILPLPPVLLSSSFQPLTSPPALTTVVTKSNKGTEQPILVFERKFDCKDFSDTKFDINIDQQVKKHIDTTTDPLLLSYEKMPSSTVLAHRTSNMSENVDDETMAISDSKTDGERHMPKYLRKVDNSDTGNKKSDNRKNDNGNSFSDKVTIMNVFGKSSNIDIEEQTGCEKTEINDSRNHTKLSTKCYNLHNDYTQENTTEFEKIFFETNTGISDLENENVGPNDVAENMTNENIIQITQTDNTPEVTDIKKISTLEDSEGRNNNCNIDVGDAVEIAILGKIVKSIDICKEVPDTLSAWVVWRDHSYAINYNSLSQNNRTSRLCSQPYFAKLKVKPNKKHTKKKSQPNYSQKYIANSKIHNTLKLTERVWKDCYTTITKSKRKVTDTLKYSTLAKNNSEKYKLEINRVYDDSGISSQANHPESDLVNSNSVNENLKNLNTDMVASGNINEVVNSSDVFPESTVKDGVITCSNIKVEYDAEERDENLNYDYGQCNLKQEEIHIKPEPIDHSEIDSGSDTETASEIENYDDNGDTNLLEPVYTADWCCTTNSYVMKDKIKSKISKTLPQAPIERKVPVPQAKKRRRKRIVYKSKSKIQNKRKSDVCVTDISLKRMKTDNTEKTNIQKTQLKRKKIDPSQPKRQSTRLQIKKDERNCSHDYLNKDMPSDENNRDLDQSDTIKNNKKDKIKNKIKDKIKIKIKDEIKNKIKDKIKNKKKDEIAELDFDLLTPVYSISYSGTMDKPLMERLQAPVPQLKKRRKKGNKLMYRKKSKSQKKHQSEVEGLFMHEKMIDRTSKTNLNNDMMDHNLSLQSKVKSEMNIAEYKTNINKHDIEVANMQETIVNESPDHLTIKSEINNILSHPISESTELQCKKSTSNYNDDHINEILPDQSNQTWNQSDIKSEVKDLSNQSISEMNINGNASNTLNFLSNNNKHTYADEFLKFLPLLK